MLRGGQLKMASGGQSSCKPVLVEERLRSRGFLEWWDTAWESACVASSLSPAPSEAAAAGASCALHYPRGTGPSLLSPLQGGVKVLITGPWQEASNNYSCLFDQISVPASLIQPGVLRCYCPGEEAGPPRGLQGGGKGKQQTLSQPWGDLEQVMPLPCFPRP